MRLAWRRRGRARLPGARRAAPSAASAPTPTSAAARSSPTRRPRSPRARRRCRTRPPGTRTSPRPRSPPTRPRRSPTSTPTAATSSTPTSARRAPTASPTPSSAPASASCRSTTPPTATRATRGPFPIPAGAPVEGGAGSDGDRHVLVVDRAAASSTSSTAPSPSAAPPALERRLGRRLGPALAAPCGPTRWTSADAAGLPIFPGLVRYDEAAAGHIDHAIRVTFDSTRDAWVHPASHCAGDTAEPRRAGDGDAAAAARPATASAASAARRRRSPLALKRYGMIVADNGSNWYFSGSSDRRWDDENLDQLKRIPGSAFEVVRSAARAARLLSAQPPPSETWRNSARSRDSSSAAAGPVGSDLRRRR